MAIQLINTGQGLVYKTTNRKSVSYSLYTFISFTLAALTLTLTIMRYNINKPKRTIKTPKLNMRVKILAGRTYNSLNKTNDIGSITAIDKNVPECVRVTVPNTIDAGNWEDIAYLKELK